MKPPATGMVLAKGVLYAYFLSLVVFLLFSVLIQYTTLTEAVLPYTAYATSLISIFIGATYVSKRLDTKGWLNGGVTGLIYLAGLVIFGLILLPDFGLHAGYITKTVLAFLAGAAGGVFGINS
ncbi:TIGR04086 family membrane protein [Dethiobacter alkaliphilus]|nr:TIGR04086 family membrane protein [Dethiobacter alkaliphilus]MCW3490792.1 TIGR04086 family membrane protein [Dethiobacter alkaliphilus]